MQDLAYTFIILLRVSFYLMFFKWINGRLKHLIFWPNHDALMKTMPTCFEEPSGKKVAVIIDRFEAFLERPSNLQLQTPFMVKVLLLKELFHIK